MTNKVPNRKDPVLEANIKFHTALSKKYDSSQPYFSDPVNTERVVQILNDLASKAGNEVLLDIGCGTGFISALGKEIFGRVVGLDATPAMLSLVESSRKVHRVLSDARHVPCPDETFNVCVAYGVLHHMEDLQPVVREIHRVLKPGGMFYSDEDPNVEYFRFFDTQGTEERDISELVQRESDNLTNKAQEMKDQFDVDEEVTQLAEYQKMVKGGMDIRVIRQLFVDAGFADVQIELRWYLGEASIRKHYGTEAEQTIYDYLTSVLPLSNRLFKYFKLIAYK